MGHLQATCLPISRWHQWRFHSRCVIVTIWLPTCTNNNSDWSNHLKARHYGNDWDEQRQKTLMVLQIWPVLYVALQWTVKSEGPNSEFAGTFFFGGGGFQTRWNTVNTTKGLFFFFCFFLKKKKATRTNRQKHRKALTLANGDFIKWNLLAVNHWKRSRYQRSHKETVSLV